MVSQKKIYLSYSQADREKARQLESALNEAARAKELSLTTWTDAAINPGEHIFQVIARAIAQSDAIVILVTDKLLKSNWVQTEIALALSESLKSNKRLIPILLTKPENLPPLLADIRAIDARGKSLGAIAREIVSVLSIEETKASKEVDSEAIVQAARKAVEQSRSRFEIFFDQERRWESKEMVLTYAAGLVAVLSATAIGIFSLIFADTSIAQTLVTASLTILSCVLSFLMGRRVERGLENQHLENKRRGTRSEHGN